MATDTAPYTRPPQHRHLWQLPTFLLGVAALVGVWQGRPHWRLQPAAIFERQLAIARHAIEQPPADPATAIDVALKLFDRLEHCPDKAGELNYVLGSAYALRAESEQNETAHDSLRSAKTHLEKADEHGVPDDDRPRLDFRLGKVWLMLGGDPVVSADRLARSLEAAEDPLEGYKLLARACLMQTPPNRPAAIQALNTALALPQMLDPQAMAPIRLQIGELLLIENSPANVAQARKVLERITPDTAEVFFQARELLARSYRDESNWEAMAQNLEKIRNDPNRPPAERRALLYQLGLCYQNTNRPDDAIRVWSDRALLTPDAAAIAPETRAAAIRLAGLRLQRSEFGKVVPLLQLAVRGLTSPSDYPASDRLTLAEARQVFEQTSNECREQGEFDLARQVAELYQPLADKGQDRRLAALASEAEALALEAQIAKAEMEVADRLRADARKLHRQAAVLYRQQAERLSSGEQSGPLQRAADAFLKADEPALAQEMLEKLAALPGLPPEESGAIQLSRGHTLRSLGQLSEALEAYSFAAQRPGPHAARARLEAALLQMEQAQAERAANNPEAAEGLIQAALERLQQNLEAKPAPEAVVLEATLYAAGDLQFQSGAYGRAALQLTRALQLFPDNPRALIARYQLGRCSWFEALAEYRAAKAPNLTPEVAKARMVQYHEFLRKAMGPLEEVETALQEKATDSPLPTDEAILWRQASFCLAECSFFLEEFEKAQARYSQLAARYQGQVEELVALSQVWQCHGYQGTRDRDEKQRDAAKAVLERIRKALEEIPDRAFDGSTPIHKRDYWTKWLQDTESPSG